MTDTNALAPCPFCGERAETDFIPEHHSYQIECSDSIGCTARITRDSELGAIEAWNCRAALAAPAQVVPAPGVEAVSEREFKQFLSDVLTAAGLVTHGKKCKDLGRRLGEMSMRLLTAPKTAAAQPVAHVSQETFNDDGTSDIIIPALPIGMALYAAPQPAAQDAPVDAERWLDLLAEARAALWQPANAALCERLDAFIDAARAAQKDTND